MQPWPLRTTVVGSYPTPGWLQLARRHSEAFGKADLEELQEDAVICAVHDQLAAGLDVITDGEQSRDPANLGFYRLLEGIELEHEPARRLGPPGHDQRGKHQVTGDLSAPLGLGVVEEFRRLRRIAPRGSAILKMSVPGPYTLSGRLSPGPQYATREAVAEALLPLVRTELEALVEEGCQEITVDEPSMSSYAHLADPEAMVELFNRTVEAVEGRCRISTHLCFGNFHGRAVGLRRYAPLFPAFLEMKVDEFHLEMANREFAELELLAMLSRHRDVAIGIVDVKNDYIETPEEIVARVHRCLQHAPAERLAFAPDCGLGSTARWVAREKLENLVSGVKEVREALDV